MMRRRVAIHDAVAEGRLFSRRAMVSLFSVIVLLFVLIANLYHLQINSYSTYKTRSNDNRIRLLPIAPNRGLIYDKNGVLLAENRPVFSLEIVPEEVDDIEQTVTGLAELLPITVEEQEKFLESSRFSRRFKRIPIKARLNEQQVAIFSVNQHRFPGVYIEARPTRYYPYGDVLTHVLGFVAKINRKDLQRIEQSGDLANYKATRDIGKQGIEKYYERFLHGQVGYREVEVNNRGRILRTLSVQEPVAGQDLFLNIDINLQLLAHQALAGSRGAIVVMDARDGAVLAMVSAPSYDPNLFVHGISSREYRELLDSKDRPLINRATQGTYPPASTIKPHLALLGLEEYIVTPTTRIWDPGWYQPQNVNRRFRDWKKWGHGWVDMEHAIGQSCDTYYYELAHKLGVDKISDFMTKFGFGDYSGIDIHEENRGTMPSRGWKRARYNQPWYLGDTISVGIGQGYWTTTPIQLASATTILANRGKHYNPRILKSFQTPTGTLAVPKDEQPPLVLKQESNWQPVIDAMYGVNHKIKGTAFKVFADAWYQSAGKTGTAQVIGIADDAEYDAEKIDERHRDNAMYMGFAPVNEPRIVVAVAVENAGGGSSNAAPIARRLMDYYMNNTSLLPEFKPEL
ncbi:MULTISPECIES: penicillin-binding protein 2 [Corallincola]|uniref:Peptidoglycan D,D-transpeptidase MrdA n=2 Tax=Corallincola TaxID=1775176 RepID=A0A368NGI0_9GAMM|nr:MULTISPECIES: penicillin-binding protein 2 [Corallincola]RCU48815.1 penicillin-binding protein 2 [Corallincola holothuriorum]TAA43710.1 penicillin-binding protein 2 [Corallincola spongiicola]